MKYLIIACLLAYVAAQHHPPNNHHPHPNGPHPCHDAGDCDPCDNNNTVTCHGGECWCVSPVVKRSDCHGNGGGSCTCGDGSHGVCNSQGHCDCGNNPVGKRQLCHNGHQCTCSNGHTGVCNSAGHCDCGNNAPVGKRAGETCTENSQCPACTHGTPTCDLDHNKCHCKHPN